MRKLILRNFQSAGDIVMLTAAVRDLHRSHPGEFLTDARTPFPDLWAHNPHLTPLHEDDRGVETIDCHYPLIHEANTTPCHFLHAFPSYLNDRLGLRIRVTDFKGDIYVSDEEKAWFQRSKDRAGRRSPTGCSVSGGKPDFTIKWWDTSAISRWSTTSRGRIQFVQVGEAAIITRRFAA